MKTPAIIASLTVVGSIAYAAGTGGLRAQLLPPHSIESAPPSVQELLLQARAQRGTGCAEDKPRVWFTTAHPMMTDSGDYPRCWGHGQRPYVADVNGDGIPEYLHVSGEGWIVDGQDQPTAGWLFVSDVVATGQATEFSTDSVVRRSMILEHLPAIPPDVRYLFVEYQLRDLDADGDLDLMVSAAASTPTQLAFFKEFWLENTGFPHPAQLTGDLDGDGKVNGLDLGILLANWQN
jgi:hypothetical protein